MSDRQDNRPAPGAPNVPADRPEADALPTDDSIDTPKAESSAAASDAKTVEERAESNAGAAEDQEFPDFEDGLRILVRDELRKVLGSELVPPERKPLKPSVREAFSLALIVLNAFLVLLMVPEEVLAGARVRQLLNFTTWVGTTALALGYAWFRERALQTVKNPLFVGAQLLVVALLLAQQVPWVRVEPLVRPERAQVRIDNGQPIPSGPVFLAVRSHTVEIHPMQYSCESGSRSFTVSRRDVLFRNADAFHWELLCKGIIRLHRSDMGAQIVIERLEGDVFDREFLSSEVREIGARVDDVSPTSIQLTLVRIENSEPETFSSITLKLPIGDYTLIATRNCRRGAVSSTVKLTVDQETGFAQEPSEPLPLCGPDR